MTLTAEGEQLQRAARQAETNAVFPEKQAKPRITLKALLCKGGAGTRASLHKTSCNMN